MDFEGAPLIRGVFAFVVIALACGGSTVTTQTPVYKAGSRLRPVVITNGVVKRFDRFHDTTLDIDCQFVELSDGKLHCAPTQDVSIAYSDAQCTQRLVAHTGAPRFVLHTPDGACGTPDVLEVGDAVSLANVYWQSNGKCTPAASGGEDFSTIKRILSPSEFVGGTKSSVARGPQLVIASIDGEDGSRQPFGIEDTDPYPGPCEPGRTLDGVLRCLPIIQAMTSLDYGDASCSTLVGVQSGPPHPCNPQPLVVSTYHGLPCDWIASFHEAGAKRLGPIYMGGNRCTAESPLDNEYYPIGKPIGDDTFAALRLVPSGEKPLALAIPKVESGETLHALTFWDAIHETPCMPQVVADGTTRCVPILTSAFGVGFGDAACTTPVVTMRQGECRQNPLFQAWLRTDASGRSTGEWRYYIIGPVAASSVIYGFYQGNCVGRDFSGWEVHSLQEITNELVELHEVTE